MILRLPNHPFMLVFALPMLSLSCSSNCTPVDPGGVVVDVTGISDCARLSASATDSAGTAFTFETWPPPKDSDAGAICSFLGLSGHAGTFTVTVVLDGEPASSQSVTVEHTDSCNIAGKLVQVDLTGR